MNDAFRRLPLFDEPLPPRHLRGVLCVPSGAYGMALIVRGPTPDGLGSLAHGLADSLRRARLATCVLDVIDRSNPHEVSRADDVELLRERIEASIQYLAAHPRTRHLPLGLVADGLSAVAAVEIAAGFDNLHAVALWCARWAPSDDLSQVITPSLLVVPGRQRMAIEENQRAFKALGCPSQLAVILGASRTFGEPGALAAAHLVVQEWFEHHLWQGVRSRHAVGVSRALSL